MFFFTACSQTDAHFDPDTADNAKQWNRTRLQLFLMCIHFLGHYVYIYIYIEREREREK